MVFLQLAFSLQSARACLARIKRALDHNQDLPEMLRRVGSLRHTWRQNLRNILERQYITDPTDFPNCSDYEGDTNVQTAGEEYNPIINTLLTYILFLKTLLTVKLKSRDFFPKDLTLLFTKRVKL